MARFILISAFVVTCICLVEGQSSCNTPSGGDGVCKSLYECESLLTLVKKKDRTPEDIEQLRKLQCGFEGNTPKVCCSETCYTPNGQPGSCLNINSCQHLAEMKKPPVSKENMAFLENSKCGSDQNSVCCGPANSLIKPGKPKECKDSVTAFPPEPSSECCGVDSRVGNKITGGNSTTVDQYPWLVIIEYVKLGATNLLCGGSLISGRYVLTAGHCVTGTILNYGTPKNVRLGEFDTQNEGADCARVEAGGLDCTEGMILVPIESTIPHPEYKQNAPNRRHDIGLIRLKQMAPFTDFIRPICLPTVDLTATPPSNFKMYTAGWGRVSNTQAKSNIKLQVDLPFMSMQDCTSAYKSVRKNPDLWRGQVCAGGERGKDSCKGDSGGPLMYENGRTYEIIGIVSYGPDDCGTMGIPGIYTKVFEYNSWIRSNIKP